MTRFGITALLACLTTAPAIGAEPDPATALVRDKCLSCHNGEAKKGGLDLTRREFALRGGESGPAIVPGKVEESLLVGKVDAGEMPPKGALSPEQASVLKRWITAGAHYGEEPLKLRRAGADWWSLRPIRTAGAPAVSKSDWIRDPIDAFILAGLAKEELTPAPEADRITWLRRVTFDLTGLPSTPEEIDAFVEDRSPTAYEAVVDRLLASPRYGERWGRHWLDVVRFAESHGYETNMLRPNAWPYRDWVIRAFNRDLPFDRFVREQLAGDVEPGGDFLTRAATGFIVGGTHDLVGNQAPEGAAQQRADDLDDIVTATGTAFLGLTVNCARCHDHKFDPIAQKDYYAIAAVFSGVTHADREIAQAETEEQRSELRTVEAELASIERRIDELEPPARPELGAVGRGPVEAGRNIERIEPTAARFVRFVVQATNSGTEPCLDELEFWTTGPEPRNAALGATARASSTFAGSDLHRLEHVNDGRVGNARSWISGAAGKGWIELDLGRVETIERIVWGRDREAKYQDRLPTEYYIEAGAEPGSRRVIASSADRTPFGGAFTAPTHAERQALTERRRLLQERRARLSAASKVYAGTFGTPQPTFVLKRGDPMNKGETVEPGGVAALRTAFRLDPPAAESDRRRALAAWIADSSNPLAARVMVNRVWHYHFGRGIVGTPGDFGFNGEPPSHPELLDHLARAFLADGGRLKPIHRRIVLSATYRQAAEFRADAAAKDRDNRLLWRFTPRRLEAEAIRDAIVAVSGRLDERMGGPGYSLWEPNTNYVAIYKPLADLGPEADRRMVYQFKPRSQADPTFGAFDCPDAALVVPRRPVSTTALQALNLLNSRFVLSRSHSFAERLKREAGEDSSAQVDRAFRLAFGRTPNADERAAAVTLVRSHGAQALCRALYNANEFLFLP